MSDSLKFIKEFDLKESKVKEETKEVKDVQDKIELTKIKNEVKKEIKEIKDKHKIIKLTNNFYKIFNYLISTLFNLILRRNKSQINKTITYNNIIKKRNEYDIAIGEIIPNKYLLYSQKNIIPNKFKLLKLIAEDYQFNDSIYMNSINNNKKEFSKENESKFNKINDILDKAKINILKKNDIKLKDINDNFNKESNDETFDIF